jgi:hypothetical protein
VRHLARIDVARDWNKHGAIAGYANTVIAAIGIAVAFWIRSHPPIQTAQDSPRTISWMWGVATLYFAGVIIAAVLHFKASKISASAASLPNTKSRKSPSPLPVDLHGEVLELYFHKDNDILGFPEHTTVVMKVQLTNHGQDQATITQCGLTVMLGDFRVEGALLQTLPDSWRIQKRKESSALNLEYIDMPIGPCLGETPEKEVYRKGVPRVGWLAFDFYFQENVEFPNAQFTLLLKDSLGGTHRIYREPMVYRKTGEIVVRPAIRTSA